MRTNAIDMPLQRFRFPDIGSSDTIRPLVTADSQPHFEGLRRGRLLLPKCSSCNKVGRPFGHGCPWCGGQARIWVEASGHGVVHSRVRFHRAYLPVYQPLIPYVVAAVRLTDGPILYGRWLSGSDMPEIDQSAKAAIEEWADGFCALSFIQGTKIK